VARKLTDTVKLQVRLSERLRRRVERAAAALECSMNAEIIKRLEQSFEQVDKMEEIFGGRDKFALFQMLAGAIGMVEAKAGSRWTDPDNVKARGEIAQAIADVLAKKVPGLHSVHIATLGEDGRHIGGGTIAYASDEIDKGGLAELLERAYADSSQSTNSQRAGSK
jgi:Arc-like DNA binding domain